MSTYQTTSLQHTSPTSPSASQPSTLPPHANTTSTSNKKTSHDSLHDTSVPDPQPNARNRLRLPPTIESDLIPLAESTRHSFSKALADDQHAALQPDYSSSFQSANDVVKRLLPYHVWHVNEDELRWVKSRTNIQEQIMPSSLKRKRENFVDIDAQIFPHTEEAFNLFARHSSLEARASKLRHGLTGGTSGSQGTIFFQESMYNIQKLAVEQERELLNAEHERLRQAKEKAIEMGISWDTLMRLGPSFAQGIGASNLGSSSIPGAGDMAVATPINGLPTTPYQKGVGSIQSSITPLTNQITSTHTGLVNGSNSLPGTPTNPNAKPRGRPRKTRDKDGKIISTPPAIQLADQSKANPSSNPSISDSAPSNTTTSSSKMPKIPAATASRPVAAAHTGLPATSSRSVPSPGVTIPSHPIPLVLPLSTLPTLSSLGIAPVPAPHLLPAISAPQGQKQQSQSSSQEQPFSSSSSSLTSTPTNSTTFAISAPVHSTAPRPAPLNQQEPALLMGITEAPLTRNNHRSEGDSTNTQQTQQMLHVSVVLSKLTPSQLSGLAQLMQSLQNSSNGGTSSPVNAATTSSTTPSSSSSSFSPSSSTTATKRTQASSTNRDNRR